MRPPFAAACAVASAGTVALAGCTSAKQPPPHPANPGPPGTKSQVHGVNQRIRIIDVVIRRDGFHPRVVAVRRGVPVRWTNRDDRPHTVTSKKGSPQPFDSGTLRKGESFRITTIERGRLRYRSTADGDRMSGVVKSG